MKEELKALEQKMQSYAYNWRCEALNKYKEDLNYQHTLKRKEESNKEFIECAKQNIADYEEDIKGYKEEIKELKCALIETQKKEVCYDGVSFICPCCKKPFTEEEVGLKKAEIEANFEEAKAQAITDINSDIERSEGYIRQYETKIENCKKVIEDYESQNKALYSDPLFPHNSFVEDYSNTEGYKTDEEYRQLYNEWLVLNEKSK